ncbi:hypothetical protein [Roseivivax sp. THAF197b]|uniref:hypothetical protein n=1 Tax=Roseivivax sp. THAF197b TaxID=2588299 RepID=UPI0012688529|nr:hypothetical protein [Roseivivax sp. THAF197b]QFS83056.1 hypothetical protein FIV09_09490 [Roseivivax sp. THAF197b]
MSCVHSDPLETALSNYFDCRGNAYLALPAVLDHVKDCPDMRKCAHRLQSDFETCSLMTQREASDLARLLRALEKDIAAGTRQQYVDDEYSLDIGGYETVLSDVARHLTGVMRPLRELQKASRRVEQAIAVDRELLRLRG